jgi:NAD+ synthase
MKQPEGLKFNDNELVKQRIVKFLKEYASNIHARGFVLGLSGGIDSSLVSALACEALGPEAVLGMIMPVRVNQDQENVSDAKSLAMNLGMKTEIFELQPVLSAFEELALDKISLGNLKARIRMAVLYAKANQDGLLVLGTGNKSELMVGYFTKYGDGGADLLPIADLYKTNVINLAEHMNISEKIIKKKPSAGLWTNQTDEEELGITYRDLDSILYLLYERGFNAGKIISSGMAIDKVERVMELVSKSEHKRNPIPRPTIR